MRRIKRGPDRPCRHAPGNFRESSTFFPKNIQKLYNNFVARFGRPFFPRFCILPKCPITKKVQTLHSPSATQSFHTDRAALGGSAQDFSQIHPTSPGDFPSRNLLGIFPDPSNNAQEIRRDLTWSSSVIWSTFSPGKFREMSKFYVVLLGVFLQAPVYPPVEF